MELMVGLTAWAAYAGGELARAHIHEREAEQELSLAQAKAAVAARAEKSVAAQKARAADDDDVRAATRTVTAAYARRKYLESVHAAFESKARLVSRELTRRTAMRDTEHRTEKWGT